MVKVDIDSIKSGWLTDNVHSSRPSPLLHCLHCLPRLSHFGKSWSLLSSYLSLLKDHIRYLEREELKDYPKAKIVLLRPSMSFLLQHTAVPRDIATALPDFSQTTHIFVPINDNPDVTQAEGGSHWSLLLVSIIDGVSFHYDSMSRNNDRIARNTSAKLEELIQKRLRFVHMEDAPQQENGLDCGVFVCILTKHLLLKRLLRADASHKVSMSMQEQKINAPDGRKLMLKLIEERKKEAERRRSWVLPAAS